VYGRGSKLLGKNPRISPFVLKTLGVNLALSNIASRACLVCFDFATNELKPYCRVKIERLESLPKSGKLSGKLAQPPIIHILVGSLGVH
jgi:hypothetical protein